MPMDITNISEFYHMFCQNNCKTKKISTFVSRYIFLLCCNTICIFQNLENILLKKMSKVLTPTSPVTRQAPKAF